MQTGCHKVDTCQRQMLHLHAAKMMSEHAVCLHQQTTWQCTANVASILATRQVVKESNSLLQEPAQLTRTITAPSTHISPVDASCQNISMFSTHGAQACMEY